MNKKTIQFSTKKIALHGVKLYMPFLYKAFNNKYNRGEYDTKLYSTTLLTEKGTTSEELNTKEIKKAVEYFKKMNGINRKIDRIPYMDGDVKQVNSAIEDNEDNDDQINLKAGHFYMSCRNKCNENNEHIRQPKVFLKFSDHKRLEDEEEYREYVVNGAYCSAFINLYFYEHQGSLGISCSLDKIMLYDQIDEKFNELVEESKSSNSSEPTVKNDEISKEEHTNIEEAYRAFCKEKNIQYKQEDFFDKTKVPF